MSSLQLYYREVVNVAFLRTWKPFNAYTFCSLISNPLLFASGVAILWKKIVWSMKYFILGRLNGFSFLICLKFPASVMQSTYAGHGFMTSTVPFHVGNSFGLSDHH